MSGLTCERRMSVRRTLCSVKGSEQRQKFCFRGFQKISIVEYTACFVSRHCFFESKTVVKTVVKTGLRCGTLDFAPILGFMGPLIYPGDEDIAGELPHCSDQRGESM